MRIAAGMGNPTRNELLAKYHLCVAGVAAVWIDSEVTSGHAGPISFTSGSASIRRQNL
jgi:hypothetical protein